MNRFASPATRLVLAAAIVASLVGCDQATKLMATEALRDERPRAYLAGTLRLDYELNQGAFLSLGGALSDGTRFWLFTVFNTAMLTAVAVILARRWGMRLPLFVALLCFFAGGIGNLIDRVLNDGKVIDFMIVGLGPVRTGVFNVADMAILFGAIAFLLLYRDDRIKPRADGLSQPLVATDTRDRG